MHCFKIHLLSFLSICAFIAFSTPALADTSSLSTEELWARHHEGYLFLDVRSEEEFQRGHLSGALNIPPICAKLKDTERCNLGH